MMPPPSSQTAKSPPAGAVRGRGCHRAPHPEGPSRARLHSGTGSLSSGQAHLNPPGGGDPVPVHRRSDPLALPCPGNSARPPRVGPKPAGGGHHVGQEQGDLLLTHGTCTWEAGASRTDVRPPWPWPGRGHLPGVLGCPDRTPYEFSQKTRRPRGLAGWGEAAPIPAAGAAPGAAHSGQNHSSTGTSWRGGSRHSMWYLQGRAADGVSVPIRGATTTVLACTKTAMPLRETES